MSINRYDLKEAVLLARGERDAELLRLTTLRELPKSLFFSKPAASALPAAHRGGWRGKPVVYSHGEVYKMVELVAATMRESGVRPATVCAVVAPSGSLEAAVFFLALVWIGAVAAPIDAGLDRDGLAVALQACAATIVVSPLPDEGADGDAEENGDAEGEALEVGARVAAVAKKMGIISWHLYRTTNEGVKLEMHGARAGASAAWKGGSADYKVDPEEVAVHLLASPPTLDPAGGDLGNAHVVDVVRLTHRSLVTSAKMFATSYKLKVEQTTLLSCALHDAHGLVVLLATLLSGGQLVLPPAAAKPKEFFAADMFWPLVSSFELDWLSASPSNLRTVSAGGSFPDKSSISFVRVATGLHTKSEGSASADDALSLEEVEYLADKVFHVPVLPAYGPAAAAGHAAANTTDANGESPGTLGKPVPGGVCLAILDPVTRAYLPKGQVGDVAVSGDGASSAVLAGAGRDEEAVRKLFLHEVLDDADNPDSVQAPAAQLTAAPVAGKYSTLAAAPVLTFQSARAADRTKHDWDSDTVASGGVYQNLPPLSARASATAAAAVAAAEAAARPVTVWFMTGDRGKLDEDGFLVVVGDAREMRAAEARKLALVAAAEQRRKEQEDAASDATRRADEEKAEAEAERRRAAGLKQEEEEAEEEDKADKAKLAAAAALAAAGGAAVGGAAATRDSWMRRQPNEAYSSVNRSVGADGSVASSLGGLGAANDGRMQLDESSAQTILAHLDKLAAGQQALEAELTAAHKARMELVQQRLRAAEALTESRREEARRDADAAAARNAAVAASAAAAAADPAVMEVKADEAEAAIMCAAAASEESAQATAAVAAAAQAAAAAAAAAERASEATAAEVRKLPPPPSAAEKAMKLAVAAAASERAAAASKAAAERAAAAALLDVVDPNNVTKVVAVSLNDVEAAVAGHPAVARARAFGRPDPRFGSEIYCAVVVKPGGRLSEPWLLLHVQSLLPAAAVPRRFYVVDEQTIGADRATLAADTKLRPLAGVSGYAGATVVRPPSWVPKSRRVQASV